LGECIVDIGVARDVHFHRTAANGAAGERNARLAQHAQHVVVDRLQLLLTHGAGIRPRQEMRAALQIEPKHDVTLRPARPSLDHALGEEIRHGA